MADTRMSTRKKRGESELGLVKREVEQIRMSARGSGGGAVYIRDIEYFTMSELFDRLSDRDYFESVDIGDAEITTAKIKDAAITTAKIDDAAITTAKIGDAQITTAKIGLAQITAALIAAAQIQTSHIEDLAVTTAKIGDAQVTTAKIGLAQITAALIANAQIQTAHIEDLAVEEAKIADLAVSSAKIKAAAITSAKIDTAAIEEAHIKDLAVSTAKIANAAITTAKIGDGQITNAKIGDAEITTAKIGLAQITTALIAAAQIQTTHIEDAAITTAKIGDAQITTAKIGDAQITNLKILDGTIEFAKTSSDFTRGLIMDKSVVIMSAEALTGWDTSDCTGTGEAQVKKSAIRLFHSTNGDQATIHSTWANMLLSRSPYFKCRARHNHTVDVDCRVTIGHAEDADYNFFGFQFFDDDGGNVRKIRAFWRSSSGAIQTEDLCFFSSDTWYVLEAYYDYNNKIEFYVDGVLEYTAESNLPTGVTRRDCFMFMKDPINGNRYFDVAYYQAQEEWS